MPLVPILKRDLRRDRSLRVAWRYVERQRGIAERQFHTIRRDHVFLRLELVGIVALGHGGPIRFRHDDARMVRILEILAP